jgi:hypothetical protein
VNRTRPLLLAAPGVALGIVGATHPMHLTPATAHHWFVMHLAGMFVFPLVGAALVSLVRRRRDPLALVVMVASYGYAVLYTALDVVSGVGNGYVTEHLGAGAVPRPRSVTLAFRMGTSMGDVGAWCLLVAALALTADVVRRVGAVALLPGLVVAVGAWFLRSQHIFWPWGVLSCLAIGIGTGGLALVLDREREPVA